MKRPGRPRGASDGAWKAICVVREYLQGASLSQNAWAVRIGQTPSSVHRALTQSQDEARWTPTLSVIYRIAKSPQDAQAQQATAANLASVPPPQGEVVQRILRDLEELLALMRISGKRKRVVRGSRRR